jgi:CheY-like chemotaxis protein
MSSPGKLIQPPLDAALQVRLAQKTLLYIEDNLTNLALVEQIIARRSDLKLLSANNGPMGLQIARRNLPDAILMDIKLPGISGLETFQILRKDAATAHIPVIALSSNAYLRDIQQAIKAGFFHYLTKPFKIEDLMDTIDASLKSTRPTR